MNADDAIRLRHMMDAAEAIKQFVAGRQREDLDADIMLAFAIVRAIEIFGEAATRLLPETRAAAPAVPWSAIIGMRKSPDPCLLQHRSRHCLEGRCGRDTGASSGIVIDHA